MAPALMLGREVNLVLPTILRLKKRCEIIFVQEKHGHGTCALKFNMEMKGFWTNHSEELGEGIQRACIAKAKTRMHCDAAI